jgi:hypothetical protein
MDEKNWWESRSLWAQAVTFLAQVLVWTHVSSGLTPDVQVMLASAIQGVVAVVMRLISDNKQLT